MRMLSPRHPRGLDAVRVVVVGTATALCVASVALAAPGGAATPGRSTLPGVTVAFHGLQLRVPGDWQVVDLAAQPQACVRFDLPTLYLGATGDQSQCPAQLVGGAPAIQLELPDGGSADRVPAEVIVVSAAQDLHALKLPASGPVAVALEGAGLLATLRYGVESAALVRHMIANGSLLPTAQPAQLDRLAQPRGVPGTGFSVPGEFHGPGFDTCAAPTQQVMDAWRGSTDYGSIGVYIGGVTMGCDQPNLTATWVTRQVRGGWHLVPVYVGLQAPCSSFRNRISYNTETARAQGQADAKDAMANAHRLDMVAPSTLYSDIEGYDSSDGRCVAAVLSYLGGWTFEMHTQAYQSGVYSSASSGMHDLSTHYATMGAGRPDDLFMAWWNHQGDVSGWPYVPRSQWRFHQRVHQYVGQQNERHAGFGILIDRDFLDVSPVVQEPQGCPANLDFFAYHLVRWPAHNDQVRAAQCLLARNGFAPGPATGILNWRTAAAIKAFKASRGLPNHESSLARYSWTALTSGGSTAPLHLGSRNPWVRKVQRALTARLQSPIRINGIFGASTRHAVVVYQRLAGLSPTGTVGVPTWHALQAGS